jgi:hypothetical protein
MFSIHNFVCWEACGLSAVTYVCIEGIKLAEADGVDWVFHVDTDELMYPASAAEYSLQVLYAIGLALPMSHWQLGS